MTTELTLDDATEKDVRRVIRGLDVSLDVFPEEALRAAQRHRREIVPELIEAIGRATEQARAGEVPRRNLHFFALYLLTEFEAKEALPTIVEAILLPDDLPYELFGSAITETLFRTLAVLDEAPWNVIESILENPAAGEYVRWSAADAYTYLVRDGAMSRGEAVERLGRQLRRAIDRRDHEFAMPLVSTLVTFSPREVYEDIAEAFRLNLVDLTAVDLSEVDESIEKGDSYVESQLERLRPTKIADTVEELKKWACFREAETAPYGTGADVDLDKIVQDFDVDWDDPLPEAAIRAAQWHREAIVPKLIELLRSTTVAANAGKVPDGAAATIALFLLAEFEAGEALPAVVEVISLPDADSYDLFGDVLTDDLSRLLADLVGDRFGVIDDLVRNEELNEYVRWTVADTYARLFRDGRISRETALQRLGNLLREAIEAGDFRIGLGLIVTLMRFTPVECFGDIERAYEAGIADDGLVSLESCRKAIDGEKQSTWLDLNDFERSRIDDTVEELRSWNCFPEDDEDDEDDEDFADDESPEWERIDAQHAPYPLARPLPSSPESEPWPVPVPIRSDQPRVGRNQPCRCGSEKKFKKCCGSRV